MTIQLVSEPLNPKPTVVYLGTPPTGVASLIAALESRFSLIHHAPKSLDALLADLQDPSSPLSVASAVLRLGTAASTGVPLGWTRSVTALPHPPPALRLLINLGHGLETEDAAGAAASGITVRGTAGGTDATATVGLYLVVAAFRLLGAAERAARSGDPAAFVGAMYRAAEASIDPAGKTVGVIGYGRIGQRTGELLRALGMRICCFRPGARAGSVVEGGAAVYDDLDAMISVVDCVLLACPYTPETHHILNWERIQKMKRGVRIVNIARGACVDEDALIMGVEAGIIGGLGLDVYESEPKPNSKLLALDCATLLPHVGGLSVSSVENHWRDAFQQTERFFYGNNDVIDRSRSTGE
ncbi:Carboxypeptidase [Pleurostoma richardsiae]|uniref:Carboxypeptidase n=1 Tax=Pleurostoma richardsiae TaxID=41990 RepID=A0AA38RDA8_9PEZI|nr:Carboxypeptidase [Pleurostoma richardsiae]